MKKKLLFILISLLFIGTAFTGVYAASASIKASKTTVTEGTKVTITVNVNAVTWNLNVSGAVSDSIVGANMDEKNQATTKTYTLDTSKAGTYTVSLVGDIVDETSTDYTTQAVNKSVTVVVNKKKEPEVTENKPNTNTNTNTTQNNTTTAKKSSNANISKITLDVEGLSFKSSQTTYNIKVGEKVDNISVGVTLSHKKATYQISGNKNLKTGNNVIKIVVTAEDGTRKTYKINVEKAGNFEESSSELSNLIIEDMTFETEFASNKVEYIGSNMKYKESLNVLPYTVSEKATYEIIGNENLKEGLNEIIVKVTSFDKTSVTEYKVSFEMLAKEEENAYQEVNPYVENDINENNNSSNIDWKEALKNHATIILLYLLALVEFGQVVYLYIKLKNVSPNSVEYRRRNKK